MRIDRQSVICGGMWVCVLPLCLLAGCATRSGAEADGGANRTKATGGPGAQRSAEATTPSGRVHPGDFVTISPPRKQGTGPGHARMNEVMSAAAKDKAGLDVTPDEENETNARPGSKRLQPAAGASASPEPTAPAPGPRKPTSTDGHAKRPSKKSTDSTATPPRSSADHAGKSRVAAAGPSSAGPTYPVAGMIGQVGGEPIYAEHVLDPIHEQLAALGRQLSRPVFRQRATQIIRGRLKQLVADALILGDAQRDLSENQRKGLEQLTQRKREQLLRKYGQGSLSLAEHNLKEQTGEGLDQTLSDYRHRVVVERFVRQKILPQVNVSRRDIQRYYHDHWDQFHTRAKRTLRLIRVGSPEQVRRVEKKFRAGTSFKQVASSKLNLNRPQKGGLMAPIAGDDAFSNQKLNQAVLRLREGESAGPFKVGNAWVWVYLKQYTPARSQSLKEAQIHLEKTMRKSQYQRLFTAYRMRLFKESPHDSIEHMSHDMMQIVMSRFAPPE